MLVHQQRFINIKCVLDLLQNFLSLLLVTQLSYLNSFITEAVIIQTPEERSKSMKTDLRRKQICGANQWTDFYMITTSVMKELTCDSLRIAQIINSSRKISCPDKIQLWCSLHQRAVRLGFLFKLFKLIEFINSLFLMQWFINHGFIEKDIIFRQIATTAHRYCISIKYVFDFYQNSMICFLFIIMRHNILHLR